eukprot:TRINITY_DN65234_c0_g1_i1.p1 TRINITY_DN65234_c0_g1~~TRINITY_DN65234_c0_g1_i1.p1  ORF type:complete len:172 (+),score=83.62 TRINITY_DN65234_c0_g1_i1:89-604(+)
MFACCAATSQEAEVITTGPADVEEVGKEREAEAARAAEAEKKKQAEETAAKHKADEEAAAAKKSEEEAAAKKAEEKKAPVEFTVELAMDAEKTPLGIELKASSLVVKNIKPGLLAAKYNETASAEKKIEIGDKLISVNDSSQGDAVKCIQKFFQDSNTKAGDKFTCKFLRE